jgi:hypothetical protein
MNMAFSKKKFFENAYLFLENNTSTTSLNTGTAEREA